MIPKQPTCRSCGAPIKWVKTAKGKNMPLDLKSEEKRIVVVGAGAKGEFGYIVDTYLSHFATCPQANEHRKPRE